MPRILVRGVNWLGDAVMSAPALQRLREAHSGANITLLTHEKLADLWVEHPGVDEILTFASRDTVWKVGRRLRSRRFDIAIAFPNSLRSALELWLARIPTRIGYARPWRNWFLTRCIPARPFEFKMRKRSKREIESLIAGGKPAAAPPVSAHHVHHYLHLVAPLGGDPSPVAPRVHVTDSEVDRVKKRFHVPEALLLGLNPGAEYGPAKRWPEERFIETAIALRRQTGCRWLLLGGKNDLEPAGRIASRVIQSVGGDSVINVAGRTTLRELCALLKACRVVVTNDTGPMHLAAAVGSRVVVAFGSTAPELTGPGLPGNDRHILLKSATPCSPCFLRECPIDFRCMRGLETAVAVRAVADCLAEH